MNFNIMGSILEGRPIYSPKYIYDNLLLPELINSLRFLKSSLSATHICSRLSWRGRG
jgi:hypothetical protein